MPEDDQLRAVARFIDAYCMDAAYAELLRGKVGQEDDPMAYAVAFAAKVLHGLGLVKTSDALFTLAASAREPAIGRDEV